MISIFFFFPNGKIQEHVVEDMIEGGDWIDFMARDHPDFCIVAVAMKRFSVAFGDECVRELRMH